jgi:hypothetical protein
MVSVYVPPNVTQVKGMSGYKRCEIAVRHSKCYVAQKGFVVFIVSTYRMTTCFGLYSGPSSGLDLIGLARLPTVTCFM